MINNDRLMVAEAGGAMHSVDEVRLVSEEWDDEGFIILQKRMTVG